MTTFLSSHVMENFQFITTEASYNRIKNILKAIDWGDVDMYWNNRELWAEIHGENSLRRFHSRHTRHYPQFKNLTDYKKYRDCFGDFDMFHTFCTDVCGINEKCEIETNRRGARP